MAKRLSSEARREQLLSVAESIVKAEGTDALTLITLADKAGVTKALTYDHFASREGLLVQLYTRYDNQVIAATQAAIASGAQSLEGAANAAATSYLACACSCGPLYEAVVSALLAYPKHQDIRLRIRDFFVAAYEDIFSRLPMTQTKDTRLKFIAVFGAIEEVARAVIAGEAAVAEAIETLTKVIVAILSD